ncbi:MAG: protein kinase, partial [bacterium]
MQKDPMIGKTVSQFKIVDYIGGGGMGTVYKAEDTKLKRLVALKFLPMEFTRNPDAKIRFKHEAQAVAALDHPRIGTIFDIIETDDGQMYIVMAYYEGETLGKKMKRGPVQLEEAFGLVLQVANGLAAAHEKGIVHRDIKPANIIITKEGFVKIVDFGLAKLGDSTRITKSGTSMGTPAFMSPEQVKGIQVDHRSDIWSLGVILYELVTGELPFKGDYEHAVMYSILNEEPEPITAFLPEAPGLEKIVKKAIAKNAAERYASMNEFIDDISEVKSLLSEANREDATVVLERKQRSKSGDQKKITPVNQDEIQTMVISDAGKNDPAEKSKRFNFKPVLTGAFVVFMVVLAVINLSKLSDFFFGADVGYLKITSDPTGAMISLDDETTGKPTPALLGPLKTGAHKISLAAAGFETWSDEFTVIENDTILVESVHLESIGAEPT